MKIGSIEIKHPLALAPMEDITDMPFRLICRRLGADIVYTEFTSCEALIRNVDRALKKIELCDEERPSGIQIFGNNVDSMVKATEIAERFKPELIDINAGCSNRKHALRGEGAGLLLDLPLFERMIKAVVKATKLPVTVKTRLGWDYKSINILDVAKMVEQSGAQALAVHCRTKTQAYKGKADWTWLEKVRSSISIPLIGNGDIITGRDAKELFELGCDGLMIGRAALHNPWVFAQIKHYLKTGKDLPIPPIEDRVKLCIEHLRLAVAHRGEDQALLPFRKYYAGYFHGIKNCSKLRASFMGLVKLQEIESLLNDFLESFNK